MHVCAAHVQAYQAAKQTCILDFSNTGMEYLHADVMELQHLTTLNLSNNNLKVRW